MKKVIVIVGPTASGKTNLSIQLASKINAEIINGDSVQIYEGLDIGSAKITKEEQQNIKHHLLSIANPKDVYSVYQFQTDARKKIEEIKKPMIVGGTGLYIQATLFDYEFTNDNQDHSVFNEYTEYSTEELYQQLINLDSNIKIDSKNRRRVIRALEMAQQGDLRSKKTNKNTPLYNSLILYLDVDRTILKSRLATRLDKQLEDGFLTEVINLREKNIKPNTIGYRELNNYLDNIYTLDEAKEKIIAVTLKLAKKQKTWFKNQMNPHFLDAFDPNLVEKALEKIKKFMKEG